MLKSEVLEIIANGENSGIEFKRDDIRPEQLAKEIVAFANAFGGRILLGVEDDGTISGLQRSNIKEWVLNVFRDKMHPQMIPYYEEVIFDHNIRIAIVSIATGISKPYVVRHNQREDIYIRMVDRSELASREQQLRLFESSGLLHVEILPVAGTSIAQLDLDRLKFYFATIIHDPEIPDSEEAWIERLLNLSLMTEDGLGNIVCSIAGLLCFGYHPRRYLKQAGLRVMSFHGLDKDYQAQLDNVLDAPLVGHFRADQSGQIDLIADGLIEKFASMITPFIAIEGTGIDKTMRKEKTWLYPWEAVREVVINAIVHRDWTRSVDIEVTQYSDRLEIISPGKMQNAMTIQKMIAGQRSPRNTIIVEIMRDYGYVDARGMGIRTKVIPLMKRLNGIEPQFEETEDYLKTTLCSCKDIT